MRVDDSRIRKKKLRIQKYPDTCGRGLRQPCNLWLSSYQGNVLRRPHPFSIVHFKIVILNGNDFSYYWPSFRVAKIQGHKAGNFQRGRKTIIYYLNGYWCIPFFGIRIPASVNPKRVNLQRTKCAAGAYLVSRV